MKRPTDAVLAATLRLISAKAAALAHQVDTAGSAPASLAAFDPLAKPLADLRQLLDQVEGQQP